MNIFGKFVKLRAVTLNDSELICEMFNDPELENLVVGWAFPVSLDSQKIWFEKNINDQKNLRFIIETPELGAIGIATLTNIDWKNRCASHGIKLANRSNRTSGIGTDTLMAIMRYAFDELGLHRLESTRFKDNGPSSGLYAKCGWTEEGIKRSCVYKKGEWRDLTIISILDHEYRDFIEKSHYWD